MNYHVLEMDDDDLVINAIDPPPPSSSASTPAKKSKDKQSIVCAQLNEALIWQQAIYNVTWSCM